MAKNINTNLDPNAPPASVPVPAPVAWIGLDWGHKTHAFALQGPAGPSEEGTLTQSAETLHAWLRGLEKRFGGQPVAVGVEAKRGAVVDALLQYPWLIVYPINPVTSARYRQAFTPSGASDDLPDARVLLELVRDHAAKLRALEVQDEATTQLAGLVEVRRDLVDRRTQVLNQLTSLLRAFYPQALELVGDLDTELAVAFLSRWPDLIALQAAKPSVVKRFYYAHNLRRPELLEQRLQFIRQAIALTTDPARVSVAGLHLQALLDQLRALRRHVAVLDGAIKTAFAAHPEAYLFRELPGAGAALAPRLCVAFGTIRPLFPDPPSLQKLAGLAPVREKSGQSVWTHWRWQAPVFLRQSFVEWAGQTVIYSAWAKRYYERMQAKGKGRGAILRALAFKWVRVLWKCWQSRTPYDEARYLKQLAHRQSPNAVPA
jgi:transposase